VNFEDQPTPTHRCKVCGAGWRFWRQAEMLGSTGDAWNLRSPTAGDCCMDAAMGDQIEPMNAGHMAAWLDQTKAHHHAGQPNVVQYAFSTDQESFTGPFDSVEHALSASQEVLATDSEPGETRAVWVGKVRPAGSFLGAKHVWIGEDVGFRLDELLSDDIPSDEPIIALTLEQKSTLGAIVANWFRENVDFKRFAVVNVTEHTVTVEGDVNEGHL
jgi:hypothetical protein